MNIAFIGNYTADAVNGVSVSSYVLAKALVSLGHQVFFYFGAPHASHTQDENGITRRTFLSANKYLLPKDFYDFLKSNPDKIAIFHIHSVFYIPNTLVAMILRKLNYPYVLTPHGGYHQDIFQRNVIKKNIYYHLFEKNMVQKASAIFYVAEREAIDLQRFGYKGITKVVPNPITKKSSQETLSAENSPLTGSFNIIYLGRYDIKHKGLDILLHIFKYVNQLDDSIRLDLYGEGKDMRVLERLAKNLNLKNIHINRPVFGDDKIQVFQNAHLYIQNSRWEAFGISIFEAALAGLPVALSEGCYMADFFEQNQLGIILSEDLQTAATQLVELAHHQECIAQIQTKTAKVIEEHFNPTVVAQLAIEGYTQAIQSNFSKK